jgi:hypothetical protein
MAVTSHLELRDSAAKMARHPLFLSDHYFRRAVN